jgi:hypothetical protein
MTNEFAALLANIALTLSLIVAIIFGMIEVGTSKRDRRERLTLEALRTFQSREFVDLVLYITQHDAPADLKQFRALPVNEQANYFQFAQEMESIGMLVLEKVINIDLVDKTLGSLVVTTWEKYKAMFLDMREKQPDPFLGEYFQWLAESIDERMKLKPRKPFFTQPKAV